MDTLITLFGEGKDLNSLQMAARAAVVFFGALILIRISGHLAVRNTNNQAGSTQR
jgi:hypothetical protein